MVTELDPGRYDGVLVDLFMTTSSNGTPCLVAQFDIVGYAKRRTIYTYFSDASKENSMKKLAANGFNGDFNSPALDNPNVAMYCKHEEYKGETREKWDFADWGNDAPPDDDTIASLNNLWRSMEGDLPRPKAGGAGSRGMTTKQAEEAAWEAYQKTGNDARGWGDYVRGIVPDKDELSAADWIKVADSIADAPPF